jgi:hypothetical protein
MEKKLMITNVKNYTEDDVKKKNKIQRLDLNTLLNRAKEQKKKNRNTQIVIGAGTLIVATVAIYLYTLFN